MAIQPAQSVTINGSTELFGAKIYSISYSPSLGDSYSTLSASLVKEDGDYDGVLESISVESTPLGTNKYEITMGLITVTMFLAEAQTTDEESGKLLRLEFVSDEIEYLDRYQVQLTDRIESHPYVIIVGNRRPANVERFAFYTEGSELSDWPDGNNLTENVIDLPEITYTFQDLLDKLPFSVSVSGGFNNLYRADYTGTVREVIGSWCNDFGLVFFWENGALFIIPSGVRLNSVKSSALQFEALVKDQGVTSINKRHSLFDTISRSTNSLFLKDGEVVSLPPIQGPEQQGKFKSLRLKDLPSFDTYQQAINLYSGDDLYRVKAAAYGRSMVFAINSLVFADEIERDWRIPVEVFNNPSDPSAGTSVRFYKLASFRKLQSPDDDGAIDFIEEQLQNFIGDGDSTWSWVVYQKEGLPNNDFPDPNLAPYESVQTMMEIYEAAAQFIGRFFYEKATWGEWSKRRYANSGGVSWIRGSEFAKNTALGPFIKSLRHFMAHNVSGHDGDSLYDLISVNGVMTGQFEQGLLEPEPDDEPPLDQEGYVLLQIEPLWKPTTSEQVLQFRDIVGVNASDVSDFFNPNQFIIGYRNTLTSNSVQSFFDSNVQTPTENINELVEEGEVEIGFNYTEDEASSAVIPRKEWLKTTYPNNFGSGNTMFTEVLTTQFDEGDILEPIEFSPNFTRIVPTINAFNNAHNLFANDVTVQDTGPFIEYSFTVPYISSSDIPSIANGLQQLSIEIGSEGVTSTYTFGNETQKTINPDTLRKPVRMPRGDMFGPQNSVVVKTRNFNNKGRRR